MRDNQEIDGLVFTGSKDVGLEIYHHFTRGYPKPVITEMGGKNPVIVTASADLDSAAEGVMRAAFGYGGQRCAACSLVYVDQHVKTNFVELLKKYTLEYVKIGNPTHKETFLGPIINKAAVETYLQAVEEASLRFRAIFSRRQSTIN